VPVVVAGPAAKGFPVDKVVAVVTQRCFLALLLDQPVPLPLVPGEALDHKGLRALWAGTQASPVEMSLSIVEVVPEGFLRAMGCRVVAGLAISVSMAIPVLVSCLLLLRKGQKGPQVVLPPYRLSARVG